MSRSVNEGFSGGEKKRNETLQMAILEPTLAILDETDSGLDIDALRVVAGGVNAQRRPDRAMIVITHHQRLLDFIVPDRVHVMADGRIVRSGGKDVALDLEAHGYSDTGARHPRRGWRHHDLADVRATGSFRRDPHGRPTPVPIRAPGRRCRPGVADPGAAGGGRLGHPAGIPDAQGRRLEIHAFGAAAGRPVRAPRGGRGPLGLAGRDRPIEYRRIDRPHDLRQRVLRPSPVILTGLPQG